MAQATTNAIEDGYLYRSPDEIAKAVMEFTKPMRRPIGTLMGLPVYVDASMLPGLIEVHHADGRIQRFSVDHPYVKGTKLEAEARRALTTPTER